MLIKDILALVDIICMELWRLRCATIERRESASLLQCPIHPWRCSGELTAVVQWGESCSHGHTAVNQTYYLVTRTPRRWCFNHCFVPVTIHFWEVSTMLNWLQMLNKLAVSFITKSHIIVHIVRNWWNWWLFAFANKTQLTKKSAQKLCVSSLSDAVTPPH